MTLQRTIHRRNARTRAKLRPKGKSHPFIVADWVVRESIEVLKRDIEFAKQFRASRDDYKDG